MDRFKVTLPAQLEKGGDGETLVRGLATNQAFDSQGESVIQGGMDLTPIDQARGVLNWEHLTGPENIVGLLDGYTQTKAGLYIEGRLFKDHTKAKAVKDIMTSLSGKDSGRMGLSVEGDILERNKLNPKIIEKCRITAVALTMNPVNTDTYVDLLKSMNASNLEISCTGEVHSEEGVSSPETFSTQQVLDLLSKALSVGSGGTEAPDTRSGGDALALEDFDKKMKKTDESNTQQCAEGLKDILEQLQILYPGASREILWEALKDRLQTKFPIRDSK